MFQPVRRIAVVDAYKENRGQSGLSPQFIALCETTGVSPQAALRGMAAMVCGLRYDDRNRLVPLEGEAA